MFGSVSTVAFVGIEARIVEVQAQISPGLPAFAIVGLPDKAVAESRERVRAAMHAIGLGLPKRHITINLAPADLPKEGSHYDLPIALALMIACGALPQASLSQFCVIGELALDGSIANVVGALPAAMGANAVEKGLICPASAGAEAVWASAEMPVLAPSHLLSLVNHFKGLQSLPRPTPSVAEDEAAGLDLRDIKGQESAKRALEVAAAGGHNLLMVGPPGSGKSMLAQRLPSILPPLTAAEMLEVCQIQSLAGELARGLPGRRRPFRAPHHSASMAALVGGGGKPRPGEVALAHLGVLFLDELPEFSAQVLDSLRQPLEAGEVAIARANHRISYPSRIQLVAAMNPCRCGRAGEPGFSCGRGQNCAEKYQARVSGPLLDRIDMQIEVPAVSAADLVMPASIEGSAEVRSRVAAARHVQAERYAPLGLKSVRTNADCPVQRLEEVMNMNGEANMLLRQAAETAQLTARGYYRTLRVARTLADLDHNPSIERSHVAEALSYRGELNHQRQAA